MSLRGDRQPTLRTFVVSTIATLSENPIPINGVFVIATSAEQRRKPTRGLLRGRLRYVHISGSIPDTDNPEGTLNHLVEENHLPAILFDRQEMNQ